MVRGVSITVLVDDDMPKDRCEVLGTGLWVAIANVQVEGPGWFEYCRLRHDARCHHVYMDR